jgi:hypothetical protein
VQLDGVAEFGEASDEAVGDAGAVDAVEVLVAEVCIGAGS